MSMLPYPEYSYLLPGDIRTAKKKCRYAKARLLPDTNDLLMLNCADELMETNIWDSLSCLHILRFTRESR